MNISRCVNWIWDCGNKYACNIIKCNGLVKVHVPYCAEGDGTLLFANKFDLRELILKTREYRPVINMARNLIAFDYDYDEKVIYWSDISLHIINRWECVMVGRA